VTSAAEAAQRQEAVPLHVPLALLVILMGGAGADAPRRGVNLVVNPGFEKRGGERPDSWAAYGDGYRAVQGRAHGGATSIFCRSDSYKEIHGAMQEIVFDTPVKHPFMVHGGSKAEKADGSDYCLYMDCWYDDGTNLWGQRRSFTSGTHDWERIEYIFVPEKPIKKIQFFILFRYCVGKAWFDDVGLELAPLRADSERMVAGGYGGSSIDYTARLSFPCKWTATIAGGGTDVASAEGHGAGVAISWDGLDKAGRAMPAGEYAVRVEAADDLLGEKLAYARKVTTRGGPPRPYAAWVTSSMERPLVTALPTPEAATPAAKIALARGEDESFQVLLRAAPGKTLTDCRVSVGALKGKGGRVLAKANVAWQEVGYVKVEKLYDHPEVKDATAGWWPDPLLPVSRFDVPPSFTQAIWFTVTAPPGTAAGDYAGRIEVAPGNAPKLTVPVKVTVYDFDLPVQPHIKTAFALMDGFLEKIYGKLTPELRQAYGDYLLRHRLNPDDISRTDPPDLGDLEHYNTRGLNTFNVLNMVEQRGKNIWVCWSPLETYAPKFKEALIARLDPYVAELKRRGLADKAYVYTFDERGADYFPTIKEYFGLIKERYGIPTLTTSQVPLDPKVMKDLNVDWMCPLTPGYDMAKADECRKAGLEVWAYVCCGPGYPYANWLAWNPLIEARVIWWQAFQTKMDGMLYWGVNIWDRANNDYIIDPERDGPRLRWSITTPGWDTLIGDGDLLYPAKDGPLGCIRLENIRDGIDDYEYLWLLGKLEGGVEKAREMCPPVTNGLTSFTRDPAVAAGQREKIARRIEALRRKSKG
jgi:hypothetical protein